jgi:hypothetical protein
MSAFVWVGLDACLGKRAEQEDGLDKQKAAEQDKTNQWAGLLKEGRELSYLAG